jgi:hypothetical protein
MAQQKPRGRGDREIVVLALIVDRSGDPIYRSCQLPLTRERLDLLGRLVPHDGWTRQVPPSIPEGSLGDDVQIETGTLAADRGGVSRVAGGLAALSRNIHARWVIQPRSHLTCSDAGERVAEPS